jgi:NAD(P)-dependent dehydrogenase (short-subunit alcohol dehydrogenase family)
LLEAGERRRPLRPTFESEDICADALCHQLFAEAERVRRRSADIPWSSLDPSRASPALVALVREAAFSELTTHSATRRFLQEFSDDVDFTQWIAVWFYEESTHPQVLMQWLHHFGERCSADAVVLASMLARRRGAIVNVGSIAALRACPGQAGYSAAKAGLVGLSAAWRPRWRRRACASTRCCRGCCRWGWRRGSTGACSANGSGRSRSGGSARPTRSPSSCCFWRPSGHRISSDKRSPSMED